MLLISKPKNCLKILQLPIDNLPEPEKCIAQNNSIEFTTNKEDFLDNFVWFCNINLFEIFLGFCVWKGVWSDIFLVVNENCLSSGWFEVRSDVFEDFIVYEYVVDIALEGVSFVADDLVSVGEEGDLAIVDWEDFLVGG